ncbi:hypothetical protein LX15_000939 [Streptoalloteichus tenebrarius]|uniref:Uncharacterized protein n=1 Tax=Streptoalloteichus tenebrarius (strain ATCC 17920 / DSM 40477 / JCM 4838 / CBS 697.72 / NBRC 16177 / NCIMB 11028 / NRRL B-12390 / A12253. 1 / ISP 5477) TaxID=1933 RepID=A0ABT1HP08_STRSD|nr:hypothetical protein [Streptoalloteichus tenebrarius]
MVWSGSGVDCQRAMWRARVAQAEQEGQSGRGLPVAGATLRRQSVVTVMSLGRVGVG